MRFLKSSFYLLSYEQNKWSGWFINNVFEGAIYKHPCVFVVRFHYCKIIPETISFRKEEKKMD
jgi:hypothetical protein